MTKGFSVPLVQTLLLIVLGCVGAGAQEFTYTTNGGTITITGYAGTNAAVTIPSTIDGLPVTSIGTNAFSENKIVTSVTIPDSVSTLEPWAFAYCANLARMTIPDSVTNLGVGVFSRSAITNVEIGAGLTLIPRDAFFGTRLVNVSIPENITMIGDSAFAHCSKLAKVALGNGVTAIGGSVFQYCTGLTEIIIPDRVNSIGPDPFYYCESLTNVTIGRSVTNLPVRLMNGCPKLTTITVDPLSSAYSSLDRVLFSKDQTALVQCTQSKVGSYTIPETVTNIQDYAFNRCTGLVQIAIGKRVTRIGEAAFRGCTGIRDMAVPNSVTTIEGFAFEGCSLLAEVTIPESVTKIGRQAFSLCSSLKNLVIPRGITSLEAYLCLQCGSLTNVTLPNTLTNIVGYTFQGCSNLTRITIPKGVVNIGDSAFAGTGLTNVLLSANLVRIGVSVFASPNFTGAYFEGDAPFGSDSVFWGLGNAKVYTLPGTTGWRSTFGGISTELWLPRIEPSNVRLDFSNNAFEFNFSWARETIVVVEACTNLIAPSWQPMQTNMLVDGFSVFRDSQRDSFATRFYRLRPLVSAGDRIPTNFVNLHSFGAASGRTGNDLPINDDGIGPTEGLVAWGNMLYGTTSRGGTMGYGTVFAVGADGSSFTNLYNFKPSDGFLPSSTLILSGETLYGAIWAGRGNGAIYKLARDGSDFTHIYVFANASDGAQPSGALVLSGNTLYGTTQGGGAGRAGTVFKMNIDGTGFSTLHAFASVGTNLSGIYTNDQGSQPVAGLSLIGSNLFGTTLSGGEFGFGTVFMLDTDGVGFKKLHAFTGGSDGGKLYGRLVASGDTLYGTTTVGGDWGVGTVFALNLDGTGLKILRSFDGAIDGARPSGLLLAGNTLYGISAGAYPFRMGTIFSLKLDGTSFTTLYNFTRGDSFYPNPDGAGPNTGLILRNNTLYGSANSGGSAGNGTVFSFALSL